MTLNIYLHFGAACFCIGLAIYAFLRDRRSFVHGVFAVGMILLGLEALFIGLSVRTLLPEEVIFWQRWRFGSSALLPVSWLLFSLSFPRSDYRAVLLKWKWILLAVLVLHLSLSVMFAPDFFQEPSFHDPSHGWLLRLGWSGQAFHMCFLLSITLIIVLLENALRTSRGQKRRKIRFFVMGIGAIFAARVYTVSQVVLFSAMTIELEAINAAALIVASLIILLPILRSRFLNLELYPSQTVLFNSITLMATGVYFLIIGILAKAIRPLGGFFSFPLHSFFVFLALLALIALFLSDRLRRKLKLLITRHFKRPQYNYREAWMGFTQRTASLLEEKELCDAVAKLVSEMLDVLSVTIWIIDETEVGLKLCASTMFSEIEVKGLSCFEKGSAHLIRFMQKQENIIDFEDSKNLIDETFSQVLSDFTGEIRVRYCVPLVAGYDLLGIMTLGDRIGGEPFTFEELDLIKTISDQLAGSLLNVKLSEHLRHAKEMEAFQTVAAFFVHDLKNLASNLSMTLQNLPAHFDNPEFRKDAHQTLSQSVSKINTLCGRLSVLRNGLELRPVVANLNDIVRTTLSDFDGLLKASVTEKLQHIPNLVLDPEQIRRVLTNLVLNANDALGDGGEIHICTERRDGWVELIVADNGCGMSREFMDQSLLRPFRTTKEHGIGIGLFQSKMIVEAHKGRIEVESEEGVGSTFRVLLPIQESQDARQ